MFIVYGESCPKRGTHSLKCVPSGPSHEASAGSCSCRACSQAHPWDPRERAGSHQARCLKLKPAHTPVTFSQQKQGGSPAQGWEREPRSRQKTLDGVRVVKDSGHICGLPLGLLNNCLRNGRIPMGGGCLSPVGAPWETCESSSAVLPNLEVPADFCLQGIATILCRNQLALFVTDIKTRSWESHSAG